MKWALSQIHSHIGTCTVASCPDILTPAFATCSTSAREGVVTLNICSDIPGYWVDLWRSGRFPENTQVSERANNRNHRPQSD